MTCGQSSVALGVYVLGALDPAERAEVDAHLAGCASCRDELAALAGVPGLLSRLTPDEAAAGPPAPSDALLESLLRRVARERAARRRRWLAAVAAVVVLIAGAVAGVAALRSGSGPSTSPSRVVAARDVATGVAVRVSLASRPSGTALTLSLTGVKAEERCRLRVVGADGSSEVAASWVASYSGAAQVTGWTAIPVGSVRELVVETHDGTRLVSVQV